MQDAFLIPTAEVPVTNLFRGQLIDGKDLPKAYVAFTPCFRSEAGSYGKDTRGLIRQHQFHKVEMVRITRAETAVEEHEALTGHAEAILQALGLHYRTVRLCGGDIGFGASLCYDIEVWLPGQKAFRRFSCSLYGTSSLEERKCATDRRRKSKPIPATPSMAQTRGGADPCGDLGELSQADGTVLVPEVLRGYMRGLDRITP